MHDICQLILREVSQGDTMQRLNEMTSGQVALTQSAFADTLRQFEIQAGQITVQEREIKRAEEEVKKMFEDGQAFVAQTQAELLSTKTEIIQQLESIHSQQREIVQFVDGMPKSEVVESLETKLEAIDEWCNVNSLVTVPVTVMRLSERLDTLTAQVDQRVTQLMQDVATTRSVVGSLEVASGGGAGKGGAA